MNPTEIHEVECSLSQNPTRGVSGGTAKRKEERSLDYTRLDGESIKRNEGNMGTLEKHSNRKYVDNVILKRHYNGKENTAYSNTQQKISLI